MVIAAPAQQDTPQSKILAKERQGLDCLKTGNLGEFAALTADDAVFVDAHGPVGKAQVLKNTAEFRLDDYTIEDLKFVPLSSKSTGNNSRQKCTYRRSGRSANISGYACSARRLQRDDYDCSVDSMSGAASVRRRAARDFRGSCGRGHGAASRLRRI
jgi:hypothetical protein